MQIYFDKFSLLEHLTHLEEDNLFKIHLVQEDEQTLEKLKKDSELRMQLKQREIEEVNRNIEQLRVSKMGALKK